MRYFAFVLAVAGIGVALVFTSAACGGGGGENSGPPLYLLSGDYVAVGFEGEAGPPLDNDAAWGVVQADGAGNVTGGFLGFNSAGTILAPTALPPSTYTIDAGRRITWNIPGTPHGGVSPDGRVASLATTAMGSFPTTSLLVRRQGTFALADLAGNYHLCAFFTVLGNDLTWFGGTASFDAAGNAMWNASVNDGTTITPAGAPIPYGSATINGQGDVTWTTIVPGVVFVGGMLAGGDLVVLAGSAQVADVQVFVVLIRKGAGLSNATFSGGYHLLVTSAGTSPPPALQYTTVTGTSTADGAGTLVIGSLTVNNDGTIVSGPVGVPTTYTVAPDGALTTGSGNHVGAVSAGGHFAMFAGGASAGDNPEVWFLHR